MTSRSVRQLIEALRGLPGIGPRAARRIADHILNAPYEEARELARAIIRAKKAVVVCSRCRNFTEIDPCAICSDDKRDATSLCIVERPEDVDTFERSRIHQGLYFVLGGSISPSDDTLPEHLHIDELEARIKRDGVKEVIIATNATTTGEATAMHIANRLRPLGVRITRPAQGLPVGSEISVVDGHTLSHAIESRHEI